MFIYLFSSPAPWENNAKKFQCEMYNMNHGEASFSQSDDTKSQDGAEIEKEPEEPTGNIDELGKKINNHDCFLH